VERSSRAASLLPLALQVGRLILYLLLLLLRLHLLLILILRAAAAPGASAGASTGASANASAEPRQAPQVQVTVIIFAIDSTGRVGRVSRKHCGQVKAMRPDPRSVNS